jgi:hypothetical protein
LAKDRQKKFVYSHIDDCGSIVSTDNVELDELHGFAGEKHPDEQENDLEYADAAFQKLLQSVPEALFIERQDYCTSCRSD